VALHLQLMALVADLLSPHRLAVLSKEMYYFLRILNIVLASFYQMIGTVDFCMSLSLLIVDECRLIQQHSYVVASRSST
jgi:hypothetical protein